MSIYLIELIIFLVVTLLVTAILEVKKIRKLGLALLILFAILVGSFVVTFILEKPKVEMQSPKIKLEINQYTGIAVPHTTYHMQDITSSIKIKGEVDYHKIGSYKIQYEVPTIMGEYIVEQIINIVDETPPIITLKGDKECNLSYSSEYEEAGFTVEDNSKEDLTQKVKIEKEVIDDTQYNLIYSVEDSAGNKTVAKRIVHIVDNIAPTIQLNGSASMQIPLNGEYKEKGATAVDEKDGDLSDSIKISGKVNTAKVGEYKIEYKVSDKSGNEAQKTRKVTVYKKAENKAVTPAQTQTPTQTQSSNSGNTGVIYLTFDDGPSSGITPKILDILKQKNVKATFFILNYSSSLEYLVKREYNEGHSIGIHGYSHTYSQIYTSEDAFMNNITKLQEKIKKTTGYSPTIIRFPGGSSNTVSRNYNKGIMTRLTQKVVANGFKYYDWNVSSEDAGGAKTSTQVYNNVTKGLKKNRANVVLMHDFGGNTKTLNALSDIIDYGFNNGYTFQTITMDTPMVTHHVNN